MKSSNVFRRLKNCPIPASCQAANGEGSVFDGSEKRGGRVQVLCTYHPLGMASLVYTFKELVKEATRLGQSDVHREVSSQSSRS